MLTRYDARRRMSEDVIAQMAGCFAPEEICATRVRENVKLAESPAELLDVFRHAPGSKGAQDYTALYDELRPLLEAP